jgi:hypothetical protein
MPRGYQIALIAAGLAAIATALGAGSFFGALYAPHYGYYTEHPPYHRASPKEHSRSQMDRDRAGLPYFAERLASAPDPEDGTEREKRDLAAQESMAVWAFWALVVSAFSVFITMAGTIMLYLQIVLTRAAIKDTSKATEAMLEANEIAEKTLGAQLRSYLDVAEIRFSNNTYFGSRHSILLKIKNRGLSPAEILAVRVVVGCIVSPNQPLAAIKKHWDKRRSVIFNGASSHIPYRIDFPEYFLRTKTGIIVEGINLYADKYGRSRHTKFAAATMGIGMIDDLEDGHILGNAEMRADST